MAVVAVAVLAGASWLGLMVAELVASFAAWIFTVGGLLAVAGVVFVVRELRHPSWGPVSISRRPARQRRALPAAPVAGVRAIEGARPVLSGVVVEDRAPAVRGRHRGGSGRG